MQVTDEVASSHALMIDIVHRLLKEKLKEIMALMQKYDKTLKKFNELREMKKEKPNSIDSYKHYVKINYYEALSLLTVL